jgi:hypothetical protein
MHPTTCASRRRARLDVDHPSRRAELRRRPRRTCPWSAARVARLWGLWDPVDQVGRESLEARSRTAVPRHRYGTRDAQVGIAGFVTLRRAKRAIGGLVGLVLMVTTVALTTYGNTASVRPPSPPSSSASPGRRSVRSSRLERHVGTRRTRLRVRRPSDHRKRIRHSRRTAPRRARRRRSFGGPRNGTRRTRRGDIR